MTRAEKNKLRHQAFATELLLRATRYSACMFVGSGRYDVRWADTLEGARQNRDELLAEYAGTNFGRGVVIYGVTSPDNLSIFVE